MSQTSDGSAGLRLPPATGGLKQTILAILGCLMFAAFLVFSVVEAGPVLLSDWQIQGKAQPIDADIQDGKCTSHLLITFCNATIRVQTPSGPVSRKLSYGFVGVHSGDYSVSPMADPAHPELVSTDLGLDRLWNRTITFGVGTLLMLGLVVLAPISAIRNYRRNRS